MGLVLQEGRLWSMPGVDKNQIAGFAVPFAALLYILWVALTQATRRQTA